MSTWSEFTEASRLWQSLSPFVQDAYNAMASDTGLTGRDMFQRSYLTGYKKLIATVDEIA
ncbi:unnamed protein product [marine sediment metagenome]|uniref:Uncharacterized protein n=1 Tax=marine sediment metagenome TaxID=412755 RepID=X1Q9C2_9ZZZZ